MKNIMVTPSILSTDFASAKLLKLLTGVKQTGCMWISWTACLFPIFPLEHLFYKLFRSTDVCKTGFWRA